MGLPRVVFLSERVWKMFRSGPDDPALSSPSDVTAPWSGDIEDDMERCETAGTCDEEEAMTGRLAYNRPMRVLED